MSTEKKARRAAWSRWLRWVLIAVVIAVLAAEAVIIWPRLEESWTRIDNIQWWWVAACVVAAAFSMDSFAQIQRTLLRSAGVVVHQFRSLALILAANSVAQTMPGGLVLAPAFTYRETRKWGATPVIASWQVVMSGLLQGVGLAVLGLGGALLAGAKTSPFSILFSVGGFLVFMAVAQYLAGHPEAIEGIGLRVLTWLNRLRGKDNEHGHARWIEILEQMRAVQLNQWDSAKAFAWSLFNWVADVACLAFACYAVGGEPSIPGLMVAYGASKAVAAAVPLLPGGLGVMDGVLVPALTSAGMPAGASITAVLVYRMISWLLVIIVGWVIVFFLFRNRIRDNGDDGPLTGPTALGPPAR